ncbi:Aste57867_10420 [Aphanomyces stellatus]|uniref:Aste57867_10420 protein n=1 Tax=Aphanomyces stellatus TaxID=120398 RepID=A0A485KQB1_9STRA|nr:hypothetical protein As57867_010380 [Aphanomyces stellatus]VFT87294.1 Aste57867_10420 [Aphanomyces stellatus]
MSVAPLLVFVANTPDSSLWSYDGVSSPQLLVASVYVDVAAMAQMPPPISLGVNGHTLYYPATSAGTTPTTAPWYTLVSSPVTSQPWQRKQSIWIQDVDRLGTPVQVQLNCSQGLLTIPSTGGAAVIFVQGNVGAPSTQLVVRGTVEAVNAALKDVVYTAAAAAAGSDAIRVALWRLGPGESWLVPTSNVIPVEFLHG